MKVNLPETGQKRIVIVGAGFGGISLCKKLLRSNYQIVLVDENNYHQFQPLLYQVAMSGLDSSSVVFPLRHLFQRKKNVYIRITKVLSVDLETKVLNTSLGIMNYDYLVMACGVTTNFFGNEELSRKVIPMKSINEALYLRNVILGDFERALSETDYEERQGLIDIVVVGGGPTGVEVAGALAEMKKYVLPKEYSEIDINEVDIHLIQGAKRLLPHMREQSSLKAQKYLEDLGVQLQLGVRVQDYDGSYVYLSDGSKIQSDKVIWAAGITGRLFAGFPDTSIGGGRRLIVDHFHKVKGLEAVYAIGDIAAMISSEFEYGHPQVAPAAIQQAENLGRNFKSLLENQKERPFQYKDKGSLATIGRNKAVADFKRFSLKGFWAWVIWLVVHLLSLMGVRNKVLVFINWVWNYITYDQSLRLIINPVKRGESQLDKEIVPNTKYDEKMKVKKSKN